MTEIDQLTGSLIDTLGLYRSEYTDVSFARVFTLPTYWRDLVSRRPSFLIGGRGTGKTMALRMLAYDGQYAMHGRHFEQWDAVGIYWRIGVNAVSAFRGRRLPEEDWTRLFVHYVNLQLVDRVLQFILWLDENAGPEWQIDNDALERTALSLSLEPGDGVNHLRQAVRKALATFEAKVNGLAREVPDMPLSLLGAPLSHLLDALKSAPVLNGKFFTICVDEFENLDDYQQRVFNTLLKHVGDSPYTLKIGTKPTGLRDAQTLNNREAISETADYSSIDIVQRNRDDESFPFDDFAAKVCNERLNMLPKTLRSSLNIRELLPELSLEGEAKLLGVDRKLGEVRVALERQGAHVDELRFFDSMTPLSAYLVYYWAQSKFTEELVILRQAQASPGTWRTRLGNYGVTMLYTIGPRIGPTTRKYYSGWSTMLALADGNIRYLLDLVTSALVAHAKAGLSLDEPVAPQTQTRAAQAVAEKLVFDLEGKDDLGKQMMRVVMGLGRAFGVMASDPFGHAPEVTQFRVVGDAEGDQFHLSSLVDSCVMHSGFVRFPGNKRAGLSGETRQYDYQLHPIFAPYFVYSFRRKRRMSVPADDVLRMSGPDGFRTVEEILKRNRRVSQQYSAETLFDFGAR